MRLLLSVRHRAFPNGRSRRSASSEGATGGRSRSALALSATSVGDEPSVRLPSWHALPSRPFGRWAVSRMSRLPQGSEPTRRRQRRAEKQAATADRRERLLHPPFAAPLPYLAIPSRASARPRGLPLAAEIDPNVRFYFAAAAAVHGGQPPGAPRLCLDVSVRALCMGPGSRLAPPSVARWRLSKVTNEPSSGCRQHTHGRQHGRLLLRFRRRARV
jgi:hypothetical protein